MPTTLIYTGKSIPDNLNATCFIVTTTDKGWINRISKLNWLNRFIKHIDITKRNLLILDGHSSNFDLEFAKHTFLIAITFEF